MRERVTEVSHNCALGIRQTEWSPSSPDLPSCDSIVELHDILTTLTGKIFAGRKFRNFREF